MWIKVLIWMDKKKFQKNNNNKSNKILIIKEQNNKWIRNYKYKSQYDKCMFEIDDILS